MSHHYLYIEKRQRVKKTDSPYSRRATRIADELEAMGLNYKIAHFDEIEVDFKNDKITVLADGEDITRFSHIIFGGHSGYKEYELKRLIVDVAQASGNTQVQNADFIKKLPYYTKIGFAKVCVENNLPHLHTYFSNTGSYESQQEISYPYIAKHYNGENDLVREGEKDVIRKNVFIIEDNNSWQQERLSEKSPADFLIQEFADAGEDLRIFVSNGKVVGGWKRIAGEGFMTVGGEGRRYVYYNSPAQEIVDICEKAASAWSVDFMALDFIYKDGKPYILEFSMNPGFHAYETKCEDGEPVNVARAIIESF